MDDTSRLRLGHASDETGIEPYEQLGHGQRAVKSFEIPHRAESQTRCDTLEKHYSINEISQLWGLSQKTIRRLFEQEPGVIELANHKSRHKRAYVTRRVPESVLRRVHRKLQKSA